MTTSTAVLITVRDALVRLGWVAADSDDTVPTNLRKRLLDLCAAKGITVERLGPRHMWVSAPQLDAYIASLGATTP